jgi:hypothetical protein
LVVDSVSSKNPVGRHVVGRFAVTQGNSSPDSHLVPVCLFAAGHAAVWPGKEKYGNTKKFCWTIAPLHEELMKRFAKNVFIKSSSCCVKGEGEKK